MEAARLMNQFLCLVIRGICDYLDSHKNKEWQGYAAIAAAVYTRDLLYRIPPTKIETAKKICDILSKQLKLQQTLFRSLEARQLATQGQLKLQKDEAQWKRFDEQKKCLQLFRLTKSDKDATYEWYKDRVEKRVEGTCQWFLKHDHFQEWLKNDSGPLLVSADPGCGKSVLARYLVDHALPRSTTICYFFFKEQDQNTVRQALCALIHQLFSQQPFLINHAIPQFRKDGQGLVNSTQSLWRVLGNAVKDPQAGPVILVIDAVDECAEPDFENLVQNLKSQFSSDPMGYSRLKCLLTSRLYEQILSKFNHLLRVFPNIHIPGEKESKIISQEVSRVIRYRVNQLAEEKKLPSEVKCCLITQLLTISHRTYLWVYLVFDNLNATGFTKTATGVDLAIGTLPKTVNDAYEQILSKSKEPLLARRTLSIILAASRPLSLSEMNIAVNIQQTPQPIPQLDLEVERDFEQSLRRWCGLFVSIHHGKIYFLHQTAREFLLADLASPTSVPSGLQWHHSITARQAHTVLTEACVRYLDFFNSDVRYPPDANGEARNSIDYQAFLDYSARTWGAHFREADITGDAAIIPSALKICDSDSKSYSAWLRIYWETTFTRIPDNFTNLMLSSHYGHRAVVKLLLENGADIEARDSDYGQTPLLWATESGHEAVVKLLLEKGADFKAKDSKYGRTPLLWAAERGDEAVVKLLLEKGADFKTTDSKYGRMPLLWAAVMGHKAVAKLLLEKGADIESTSRNGRTSLSWAAERGHEAVTKLLLEKGADVEANDSNGQTPLSLAAEEGMEAVVKLLLEKGADVEAKGSNGQTPLSWAAECGEEAVVKLLLERGADTEAKDSEYGRTPLSWATEGGSAAVVKLLLEKGADVEAKDSNGQPPLSLAAERGYKVVVKLLQRKSR
ncbi:Ankyrin repeat domain-containing protein 50 [Penicillium subrubescens]|uniref:Ankyrin repeat domain-containing protein 50 n=1 Tax=Penicillium subrubescens TaxID=1316194 RepID=A0A1Q5TCL9_9EURO|nr:Ankyrin repeat domain-containing protein 50 [Penicillium subrubescens]